MDYCINCGADLTDEMEHCPECGAARLGRRPAPFTPTFPSQHQETAVKEPKPTPTEPVYVPQEPQEEILRDQPAPVDSGHEPGEPVVIDADLNDMSDLAGVIATVTDEPVMVTPAAQDPQETATPDLTPVPRMESEYEEYYDDPAYDVLSTAQYLGTVLLMGVPVIGWLATLIWALGGTKNFNRRNLARGVLLTFLIVVGVLLAAGFVVSYFFGDVFATITDKLFAIIDVFK